MGRAGRLEQDMDCRGGMGPPGAHRHTHCNSSPLSKQIQDPRIRFTKPEWATAVRAGRNSSSFVPKRHHKFYIYVFDVKVPLSIMAKWSWGVFWQTRSSLGLPGTIFNNYDLIYMELNSSESKLTCF